MGVIQDSNLKKTIPLRKKIYGSISVENMIDRSFKEFGTNSSDKDL